MADTGTLEGRLEKGEDAERRLERSWLLNVEGFLGRRSPGFVILIGLLLLTLIWVVDLVSGSFAVGEFYLVPIGVVAFSRGRWVGTLMAFVAALAWGAADVATHVTTIASSVTEWNFLTRFFIFEAVVVLVAPMRDVLIWQRELAAKEAATASELRALIELRETLMHGGSDSPFAEIQGAMDEDDRVEERAELEA